MDTELVIRAQRGDEVAFAAITQGVYARLRAVAYRILRDPCLAEDATQVALMRIWRTLPRLRDPSRFEAWSYRYLVHACAEEARRSRRALPHVPASQEPVAADPFGTILARDQLERAFARLSVDQRAVIVLRHYLDLKLEDAAEALGVPVGTVNSRLNRALAKMRTALEIDAPSAPAIAPEVVR
jgi:RNA polymerase sigma factor (sigma-70 family)